MRKRVEVIEVTCDICNCVVKEPKDRYEFKVPLRYTGVETSSEIVVTSSEIVVTVQGRILGKSGHVDLCGNCIDAALKTILEWN